MVFDILTASSMASVDPVQIPSRSLFRQPEVCEIAQVQAYVLRSWEAEFQDLGVAKVQGGPRVYRRADVERVLRIKHLLFVEGLTIAGAHRKLQDEQGTTPLASPELDDLLTSDVRERILSVRQSLRELSAMLSQRPGAEEFVLAAPVAPAPRPKRPSAAAAKTPAKRAGKKK
jgi:DNA-binding transcriptional MerR regulator